MRRFAYVALAVATVMSLAAPVTADPGQRDLEELALNAANRYLPQEVGKPVDMSYVFGPYVIPPGQDSNRITVDVPIKTGYMTAVAPDLIDTTSGRVPTQQEAHIHHAHWFRATNDPEQEYYTNVGGTGLSWVFGTGEEKSQGRLEDRSRLAPENNDADLTNDFVYGIPVDGTTPQVLIYMIHNKLPTVGNFVVALDVTFIPGTREEIKAATGKDVRPLYGQLWGQTKDVTDSSKNIGARWTAARDATAIAMGSHLHPGGKMVVVSNLGPDIDPSPAVKPLCQGVDPDGDGYDGVAILNSYKFDRDMDAWPYSENYQMGTTKFGWRAPIHAGDILEQKTPYAIDPVANSGVYSTASPDGLAHNWYEAMSYTGIYMDREQSPGPKPTSCTLDAFAPQLLGDDTFAQQGLSTRMVDSNNARLPGVDEIEDRWNYFLDQDDTGTEYDNAIQGMVNHIWQVREPLCAAAGMPALAPKYPSCGPADVSTTDGPEVTSIHAAGFLYAPGDLGTGSSPIIPKVRQGTRLTFVNEDVALNVRHTFTSCAWPCLGTYVSNFPLPNGGANAFDTGKIGNIDYIDGGLTGDDTLPFYEMNVNLPVGKYSYYCRIHPFMRGAFQVIPA